MLLEWKIAIAERELIVAVQEGLPPVISPEVNRNCGERLSQGYARLILACPDLGGTSCDHGA